MSPPEPKHIVAERLIREAIRNLQVGDKLPGERVLAKQFGVSYMTARKAVESLVAKGILAKVAKKGTYITSLEETGNQTRNLGYFLDSSIQDGVSSPYYSLVFDALDKEAAKHGYTLMYFSDFKGPESVKKMDGVIISCFPRIEKIVHEIQKLLPVVCIDNSSPDDSVPSVTIDNYNPVFEAVNYLCFMGHERIGFITGLDDSDVGRKRLAGYLNALKSRGVEADMNFVYKGDYSFETGTTGADYFLSMDNRPTAMVCANDTMAVGAFKEIVNRGMNVPGDMSIIGFDDISIASQVTPSLTTISAPVGEIAKQSVEILLALINGSEPDKQQITLPCRLVLRDSCAAAIESPPSAA